jgi:hypothetical protein
MLIRSQDKKKVAILDNTEKFGVYEYEKRVDEHRKEYLVRDAGYGKIKPNTYAIETVNLRLGEYSSEEKAIKVLDKICENYMFAKTEETYHEGIYSYEPVYQMPQDSEVG